MGPHVSPSLTVFQGYGWGGGSGRGESLKNNKDLKRGKGFPWELVLHLLLGWGMAAWFLWFWSLFLFLFAEGLEKQLSLVIKRHQFPWFHFDSQGLRECDVKKHVVLKEGSAAITTARTHCFS